MRHIVVFKNSFARIMEENEKETVVWDHLTWLESDDSSPQIGPWRSIRGEWMLVRLECMHNRVRRHEIVHWVKFNINKINITFVVSRLHVISNGSNMRNICELCMCWAMRMGGQSRWWRGWTDLAKIIYFQTSRCEKRTSSSENLTNLTWKAFLLMRILYD